MANNNSDSEFRNIKQADNCLYRWVINNVDENFDGAESPIFSNEKNYVSWRMQIERTTMPIEDNTVDNVDDTAFCMKLFVISNLRIKILAKYLFQIKCVKPEKTLMSLKRMELVPGECYECFRITKFWLTNAQNGFVQDGKITITCEIKTIVINSIPRIKPKCTLPKDLENFFENRKFTDVTLCASDQEFQAHKGILVSRSRVFSAMFEHRMAESLQNRVNMPDINGQVLQELLRYMYTGKVLQLKTFAIDLLPLADKYNLKGLRMLCEEELCTNISIENAAEILILADLHKANQLRAVAIGYIVELAVPVSRTDGWNLMIQSYPHLVTEILCEASRQLQVMA